MSTLKKRPFPLILEPIWIPLVGLVASIVLISTFPIEKITLFVADDTYYYLKVALNVPRQGHFTFDGIHHTSGFHPLWQMLLVAAAFVVRNEYALLYVALTLEALLACLAGVLLYSYVKEVLGRPNAILAQSLWSLNGGLILTWFFMGMENVLFACSLLGSLLAARKVLQRPDSPLAYALLTGLVFSLMFLSRTDSILLLAFLVPLLLLKGLLRQPRAFAPAGLITAVLGATTGTYLLFNIVETGYGFQISGTVKVWQGLTAIERLGGILTTVFWERTVASIHHLLGLLKWHLLSAPLSTWPQADAPLDWLRLLWLVPAAGYIVGTILHLRDRPGPWRLRNPGLTAIEVCLVGYTVIHTAIEVTILAPMITWTSWYLVPQILLVITCASGLLYPRSFLQDKNITIPARHRGTIRDRFLPLLLALGMICCSVVYLTTLRQQEPQVLWNAEGFALARWMQENIPSEARIGAWDTGLWSYFSGRTIINLDGLMNDYEFYHRYLSQGRISEYIDREGIKYLITWTGRFNQCQTLGIHRCLDGEILYQTPEWTITGGTAGVQVVRLAGP